MGQVEENRLKKFMMRNVWRIQQSQAIISIVFWSLTLTGVFYDKVALRFNNFGLQESNVTGGIIVMFLMVICSILLFGMVYDRLRFLNEQIIVFNERNPYSYSGRMTPKEIIMWSCIANPTTESRQLLKAMIENNLADPKIQSRVDDITSHIVELMGGEGQYDPSGTYPGGERTSEPRIEINPVH